jgi:hypothetical protein
MFREVVESFFPGAGDYHLSAYGTGHINDTFKLVFKDRKECYILQRINTMVFTDPSIIADAHLKVQEVIKQAGGKLSVPFLVATSRGLYLYTDTEGNVWRLTTYISDSYTIEFVKYDWQAFEAGNAFGWFVKCCDSLNVNDFRESIKDFHKLPFRIGQLQDSVTRNHSGNLDSVTDLVEFYRARETRLLKIQDLVDSGQIPLRVVHNDTKINNLLFKGQEATTVIDLDTVGPGIIYHDYGDALRTTASTAAEDEKDLDRVHFNISRFDAFTRGYLGQTGGMLCPAEKESMHLAPMMMTYIMGIRFLADYINGDIYYKTSYPEHNADRSRVQKKLIESMELQENEMKDILEAELKFERSRGIPPRKSFR